MDRDGERLRGEGERGREKVLINKEVAEIMENREEERGRWGRTEKTAEETLR